MQDKKPVLLAISAASGMIWGMKILEFLLINNYNVELIISGNAYSIIYQELGLELKHDVDIISTSIIMFLNIKNQNVSLKVWLDNDMLAGPASGSYQVDKMIIVPASMATIAKIASGIGESLITRAADVIIKEGKSLIIVPRETPFSTIHLENMLKLSKIGIKIVPPIVGFYGDIKTLDDSINFVVGKILDSCGIANCIYKRWKND